MECAKLKLSARELRMLIMAVDYLNHDRLAYDEDFNPIMQEEWDALGQKLTELRMDTMSRPAMAAKWQRRLKHAAD